MLLQHPFSSARIEFTVKPHVVNAEDARIARARRDGFSIISCTKIDRHRKVGDCKIGRWEGQDSALDKIALRAMKQAIVSPDSVALFRSRGDDFFSVTFRFSALTDLPSAPCPPTWCHSPLPPPPPPPARQKVP